MSDAALVLVGLGAALALLAPPLAALVLASRAHRAAREQERRLDALSRRLEALHAEFALAVRRGAVGATTAEPVAPPAAVPTASTVPDLPAVAAAEPPRDPGGVHGARDRPSAGRAAAAPPAAASEHAASGIAAVVRPAAARQPPAPEVAPADGAAPTGGAASPRSAASTDSPSRAPQTIEERIGLTWFTRIGVLLVIVGLGFFFKYMIDNDWIGPWGRVGIGLLAGLLALGGGELLNRRRQAHRVFVEGLIGLGLALLLVTTYASFSFYHLVPVPIAFAAVAVLAVLGGALAALHKAESILVLALLAAFLNPALLSTGSDRPVALFGYLLLMTSGALFVAARLRFKIATWLSVLGSAALAVGWWSKYFDTGAAVPEISEAGAYLALSSRWAPLLAAVLFPAQWTALAFVSAGRSSRRGDALPLVLVAALAGEVALSALLWDTPLLVAAGLVVMAGATAAVLWRARWVPWLGVPSLIGFGLLVGACVQLRAEAPLLGLLLAALWAGVPLAAGLAAARRAGRSEHPGWQMLLVGPGVALVALACLLLVEDHAAALVAVAVGVTALYLAIAVALRSGGVALAGALLGLVGLSAAAASLDAGSAALLVGAVAWLLLVLATSAVDLFVLGRSWSAARQATLAIAAVGFGALLLRGTAAGAHELRAALVIGAGVLYLLVGLRMRRAGEWARPHALLPVALALSCFTWALALLFSGTTVTLLWLAEAVVLAYLAASHRDRGWLAAAVIVLGVALVRGASFDLTWAARQARLFQSTLGAEGGLTLRPLLHPRALMLLGTGAAGLIGARVLGRRRELPAFSAVATGLLLLGHLALLALAITEVRLLATQYPAEPTAGLPADEFRSLLSSFQAALAAQRTKLNVLVTVVGGVYASILLAIGFAARDRLHRLLGIVVFGATLAKLALWDLWELERPFQILGLVTIGLLLLAGGFLYARFGKRILRQVLSDDSSSGWLILALLVPALGLTGAQAHAAVTPSAYAQRRTLQGAESPGHYRWVVDPPLYAASQSRPRLQDLRIVDSQGEELPWALRPVSADNARRGTRAARVLDPVRLPDGGSQAVLDLGGAPAVHHVVELTLGGGRAGFLRSTRVESSQDGSTWGVLAHGGYVFDIAVEQVRSRRTRVAYPRSRSRYLRVTLAPGADEQALPITAARVEVAAADPAVERGQGAEGEVTVTLGPSAEVSGQRTEFDLGALPVGLPVTALRLETSDPAFVRRVRVRDSTGGQVWRVIGAGHLFRVPSAPSSSPGAHEWLRVGLSGTPRARLRLSLDHGDDPPLTLTGVRAVYPQQELVIRVAAPGPLSLFVGRAGDPGPRYDLPELLRRRALGPLPTLSAAPLEVNPLVAPAGPAPAALPPPLSERYAWLIRGALGVAVLGLIGWTVVLLRRMRR